MLEKMSEPNAELDDGLRVSRVGATVVASRDRAPAPAELTPAEQSVVQGLLRGLSTAAIARERGTATKTVANQLHGLYRKFNVSSREQLLLSLLEPQQGAEREDSGG